MPRRRPLRLSLIAIAIILVGANWTDLARAASMNPTYTLVAPAGLPDPGTDANHVNAKVTLPQVIALIQPTGGVLPPIVNGQTKSPLTILPGSTGFNQDSLTIALSKDKSQLGLIFFSGGIQPGGTLHFALNPDPNLATPVLMSQTPGIIIAQDTIPTPTIVTASPNVTITPEPISMVLWMAVGGIGLGWRRLPPVVRG